MIEILKKSDPLACGGTDATQDSEAPKTIQSEEMILFEATSALGCGMAPVPEEEPLGYVSAFAAPAAAGTLLYFEKSAYPGARAEKDGAWALIREDPFPALVKLVREQDLALYNGFHSRTHGLPEDFGGSVRILYASGESVRYSNNQSPVLSQASARAIAALFENALQSERVPLPDCSSLTAIRFAEEQRDGGYTKATLTLLPDGTGINRKTMKFDDPKVYESEKPVDAETVAAIKKTIESCGMLAWEGLPGGDRFGNEKAITFVFANGAERTVRNGRTLPGRLGGGFFNIELEMTTKH